MPGGSLARYRDWLSEALDDYAAAEDLARLGRYSKACFFAHQAAEKALKALMMKRLRAYTTIHSVVELLRRLERGGLAVPRDLYRSAEHLDRLYIPTRYPNAWPWGAPHEHYGEEDAREALRHARRVLEYVEREIEKDP